ncbi:MAG: hypothetical protein ACE5NA_06980 [Nitrospiraceae bacterium]
MGTPKKPAQVADLLVRKFPQTLTPAILEEYGLESTPEQAKQISRELLSLNLFWAQCAVQTVLSDSESSLVVAELQRSACDERGPELGTGEQAQRAYFAELGERRATYTKIMQEGGAPIAIFTEAASLLEAARAVRREDRQKVLALFVDLVPVDELGEELDDIDLDDS